jgi:hypothetical protein
VGAGRHQYDVTVLTFDEDLAELAATEAFGSPFTQREQRGAHGRETVLFDMRR